MLLSAAVAQTKVTKPTPTFRPAKISGRVFLITKSGDLKPARMAFVYLFFENTMPKFKGESDESRHRRDGDTVGSKWVHEPHWQHTQIWNGLRLNLATILNRQSYGNEDRVIIRCL